VLLNKTNGQEYVTYNHSQGPPKNTHLCSIEFCSGTRYISNRLAAVLI